MIFGEKFLGFGKKKNNECPIDKELKDKILDTADKCAERINSKYLSKVKSMMKDPNHKDGGSYSKEDINETNFTNITIQFNADCYDFSFESISQDVYFDIDQNLDIWHDIADIIKNDLNKVISNPEFKIKKYQIVDDCAVIVLIFKP